MSQAVRRALLQPDCSAVLVLFDGGFDCPADLGPTVQRHTKPGGRGAPGIDAWFLAVIESLRGHRGVRNDAEPHLRPERPRGAKEQLEARMQLGATDLETTDQPALSAMFSFPAAYGRSRSFRKLADSFGHLVRAMGREIGEWSPAAWAEGP